MSNSDSSSIVPLQGRQRHQESTRRVGDVGHVHPAICAAREIPEHPAVRRSEQQFAALGTLACAAHVLEDPHDLGAGEIGREGQSGDRFEALDPLGAGQPIDDLLGARVLPDDRVVDGLPGRPVPDDGGLTLVGDPDTHDIVAGDVGLGEGGPDDLLHVSPDLDADRVRPSPREAGSARAPSDRQTRWCRSDRKRSRGNSSCPGRAR